MEYNPFSLKGKTILVTGASSGIGRAAAIECSKMGARLIIVGRNVTRLDDTLGSLDGEDHRAVIADVADNDALANLVKSLDKIDGAVLSAGIGGTAPVKFADRAKYDRIFNTNFFATVELVRLLAKNKKIAKEGSIVLIDSIGGVTHYTPGNSIYGASKAALNAFSKYAAVELASGGFRFNCICPGMIQTPLINNEKLTADDIAKDMARYLNNRYGTPEEVAYAAIYLLSDATKWVTGTSLIVDGGVSVNR